MEAKIFHVLVLVGLFLLIVGAIVVLIWARVAVQEEEHYPFNQLLVSDPAYLRAESLLLYSIVITAFLLPILLPASFLIAYEKARLNWFLHLLALTFISAIALALALDASWTLDQSQMGALVHSSTHALIFVGAGILGIIFIISLWYTFLYYRELPEGVVFKDK